MKNACQVCSNIGITNRHTLSWRQDNQNVFLVSKCSLLEQTASGEKTQFGHRTADS